jgi:hypothetical protein
MQYSEEWHDANYAKNRKGDSWCERDIDWGKEGIAWEDIFYDIQSTLVGVIDIGEGDVLHTDPLLMRLPFSAFKFLTIRNEYDCSVYDLIRLNYPKMEIIFADDKPCLRIEPLEMGFV